MRTLTDKRAVRNEVLTSSIGEVYLQNKNLKMSLTFCCINRFLDTTKMSAPTRVNYILIISLFLGRLENYLPGLHCAPLVSLPVDGNRTEECEDGDNFDSHLLSCIMLWL